MTRFLNFQLCLLYANQLHQWLQQHIYLRVWLVIFVLNAFSLRLCSSRVRTRYAYSNCCCLTALGILPVFAHNLVVVFCWPKRTSSWNQTSPLSKLILKGMLRVVSIWRLFKNVLDALWLLRMFRSTYYPWIPCFFQYLIYMISMIIYVNSSLIKVQKSCPISRTPSVEQRWFSRIEQVGLVALEKA